MLQEPQQWVGDDVVVTFIGILGRGEKLDLDTRAIVKVYFPFFPGGINLSPCTRDPSGSSGIAAVGALGCEYLSDAARP